MNIGVTLIHLMEELSFLMENQTHIDSDLRKMVIIIISVILVMMGHLQ